MTTVRFASKGALTPRARAALAQAKNDVFGTEEVKFVRVEPGPGVMCFGVEGGTRTLSMSQISAYPFPERYLRMALRKVTGGFRPSLPEKTLFLDIETHNEGKQWGMPPRDFFRLGQYAWGIHGKVRVTTDYDEVMSAIAEADLIVAQNGHPFDVSVLFGKDSIVPLEMAKDNKILDTMVLANLTCPAPIRYTDREGKTRVAVINGSMKPEMVRKWLSLDNLCYQLGLDGKEGNLRELAKRYNPKGTKLADLDYGLIPLDDEDFIAYAVQDVRALQELTWALLAMHEMTDYDWREQLKAAIDAQNTRNGFVVDLPKAQARVEHLAKRREEILTQMQKKYGLPTEGKMPWKTTVGKEAIFKALADEGITPKTTPDWPLTDTGNLSLGGPALTQITEGTPAEDMGVALAELMGQRSLAQLALDSVREDGKAHPDITSLQRSGRSSTTKPGLTVWTSRGDNAVEKEYFVADNEDELLVEFDFSQADARIVAAYSGDIEFKERFKEGVDAHELTGRLVFGNATYEADPEGCRFTAKALGHAYAYRAGPKTLAKTSKQPLDIAERFVERMQEAYPLVTEWQDRVTDEGAQGFIVNDWGRKIVVEPDRAYTQAPAMYGQSGTRELMVDALIRMLYDDVRLILWLRAQIHDALLFSIPKTELVWAIPKIKSLMEVSWQPKGDYGQEIWFPVGSGEPAPNWYAASH